MRTFQIEVSPRAPIPCIRANDLTLDECKIVLDVMRNNWTQSTDYRLSRDSGAHLRDYATPGHATKRDGQILIEFFSSEKRNIEVFAKHLGRRMSAGAELTELVK